MLLDGEEGMVLDEEGMVLDGEEGWYWIRRDGTGWEGGMVLDGEEGWYWMGRRDGTG